MTPEALLIVTIVELVLRYGAPAAIKIWSEWAVDHPTPTLADIQALKDIKMPEEYFDGMDDS